MKTDMVTGRKVPDETKRVPLFTYANPRPASWPAADFIVGNPPFIGNKRMRENLGDGYSEALRSTYPDVPESADFVMYWWHKAAELVRANKSKRFGLITTNSLRQTFNRALVQSQLFASPPASLVFAIPDHPWVDTADGAAVRIAMTVGVAGEMEGEFLEVKDEQLQADGSERVTFNSQRGKISADITLGANVGATVELKANENLAIQGAIPHGDGFRLTRQELESLGYSLPKLPTTIKDYWIGSDLVQEREERWVIDFYGLTADEARDRFPSLFQRVLTLVKPERDQNKRQSRRDNWWLFAENVPYWRRAVNGLPRFIATCRTAKHRLFVFLPGSALPDAKIIGIALDDAFFLGLLSSRIHCCWALRTGSFLEDRPNYNHSECFGKFPFPLCGEADKERIRKLAEELDAHRKRVQAQHGLTLTGLYNVLEKLRAGDGPRAVPARSASPETATPENSNASEPVHPLRTGTVRAPSKDLLTAKEKLIHDQGLVSVLKQLHDDLDAAVFAAYGWPATLTDAEILERLVALNAERAAEEKRGIIRWLRPEYQAGGQKAEGRRQKELSLPEGKTKPQARKSAIVNRKSKMEWPKSLAERVKAVEAALHNAGATTTPAELAQQFKRAKPADVAEILQTLVTLGRARRKGNQFSR